jgi:hypothetical protein
VQAQSQAEVELPERPLLVEQRAEALAQRVLAGDRLALARAVSAVENSDPSAAFLLRRLAAAGRRSHRDRKSVV